MPGGARRAPGAGPGRWVPSATDETRHGYLTASAVAGAPRAGHAAAFVTGKRLRRLVRRRQTASPPPPPSGERSNVMSSSKGQPAPSPTQVAGSPRARRTAWAPADSIAAVAIVLPAHSPAPEREEGDKEGGDREEVQRDHSGRDPRGALGSRELGRTCCSTATRRHQDLPRATRRSGSSARCSAQRRPGIMLNLPYRRMAAPRKREPSHSHSERPRGGARGRRKRGGARR